MAGGGIKKMDGGGVKQGLPIGHLPYPLAIRCFNRARHPLTTLTTSFIFYSWAKYHSWGLSNFVTMIENRKNVNRFLIIGINLD